MGKNYTTGQIVKYRSVQWRLPISDKLNPRMKFELHTSGREIIRRIWPLRAIAKAGFPIVQWLNHRRRVVKTVDGITYDLNLNELIDSTIYYFGAFEPDSVKAIKSAVRPGFTA